MCLSGMLYKCGQCVKWFKRRPNNPNFQLAIHYYKPHKFHVLSNRRLLYLCDKYNNNMQKIMQHLKTDKIEIVYTYKTGKTSVLYSIKQDTNIYYNIDCQGEEILLFNRITLNQGNLPFKQYFVDF